MQLPADEFGPYRLLARLGEGGMGEVYLAEQVQPMKRRVALKVVREGIESEEILARFADERSALARMSSQFIAKLLDVGTSRAGRPYLAMEFVEGRTLIDHCDRERLDLPQRVELFLGICQGVQHAHHKGIVHGDLKPSNVLVAVSGGIAVPKIIDFGLSYATDRVGVSRAGGTLEYMSPELVRTGTAVDTRVDVYSLGVLLYELTTGTRPHASVPRSANLELQRRIVEDDPELPSDLCAPPVGLRDDLDWVVMKAMAKHREHRYSTAAALAADVRRFLRHEPVVARPPSVLHRASKFARRHRFGVAAGVVVLVLLVAWAITGTALHVSELRSLRAEAAARADTEENLRRFDQLAGVVLLAAAKAKRATLLPARPEIVAPLRAWIAEEGEPLLARRVEVQEALAGLRALPEADRYTTDADSARRLLREALGRLSSDLDDFAATDYEGARADLAWAEVVRERTVERHRAAWESAAAAVRASGRFGDFVLAPQIGLVPLGVDPRSGLPEFYDLRSAEDPDQALRSGTDGTVPRGESAGVVFVLLPGGEFDLGAQSVDPGKSNYDPGAEADEGPVHRVKLAPFLLSKFELTQAQWRRITRGSQPSVYAPGSKSGGALTCPVENIDWTESERVLAWQGWMLPTEAQWEYACRGGVSAPWYAGDDSRSLKGHENIADLAWVRARPGRKHEPWLDDGHGFTAPVGTYQPNPFGLHDMLGNVWEWCRDRRGPYTAPLTEGDGERAGNETERMLRGGSFAAVAGSGRSARRNSDFVAAKSPAVGVRPARRLDVR